MFARIVSTCEFGGGEILGGFFRDLVFGHSVVERVGGGGRPRVVSDLFPVRVEKRKQLSTKRDAQNGLYGLKNISMEVKSFGRKFCILFLTFKHRT